MITITLPFPDMRLSSNQKNGKHWGADELKILSEKSSSLNLKQLASILGRTEKAIKQKQHKLGYLKSRSWTKEEIRGLIQIYNNLGKRGVVSLDKYAEKIGRHKTNVCRKARELGLGTNQNRNKVPITKERVRRFETQEELRAYQSRIAKDRIQKDGHPKRALGMKHTDATRNLLSKKSKETWARKTEEQKDAAINKRMKTMVKKYGKINPNRSRGSWNAGWREFGGKRNYYRSLWEANYARYLQWLKSKGEIIDWEHEPETFWFEQIRRGVRSYLPDFRVWENDGSVNLHEVKGWMDSRSRTTLKRMAKYHPSENIILIREAEYKSIKNNLSRIIPDWEESPRDRRL